MMKKFNKARLGLAMTVALAGGASFTTSTVSAASISNNGLGQVLIFPYYTVRDGYQSLFNITNTSGATVAVKVRFRESHNSRDVLDFNLVLSPYDVWTGYLADSAAGPVLKSDDKSCTSPLLTSAGFTASNVGYSGVFADGVGNDSIDRAREGYVEVITMGYYGRPNNTGALPAAGAVKNPVAPLNSPGRGVGAAQDLDGNGLTGNGSITSPTTAEIVNPLAYYAKHVNGTPRSCANVDSYFLPGAGAVTTHGSAAAAFNTVGNGLPAAANLLSGAPNGFNPLKGNFSLVKVDGGVAGGTTAVAIANFYAGNANVRTIALNPVQLGVNLVTAQFYPYFLEPALASANGLWTVSGIHSPAFGDAFNAGLGNGILQALQSSAVVNEWANAPATGAGVDWVVSMPMKNFFVDAPLSRLNNGIAGLNSLGLLNTGATGVANNFQAAINSARGYDMTAANTLADVLDGVALGSGLDDGGANDDAAGAATLGLVPAFSSSFSGSKSDVNVTYTIYDREETNRTLSATTVSPQPPSTAQALKYEVNVLTFDGVRNLKSGVESNVTVPAGLATKNGWLSANTGSIPTVGFIWKKRDFGVAAKNFGQVIDHAYTD